MARNVYYGPKFKLSVCRFFSSGRVDLQFRDTLSLCLDRTAMRRRFARRSMPRAGTYRIRCELRPRKGANVRASITLTGGLYFVFDPRSIGHSGCGEAVKRTLGARTHRAIARECSMTLVRVT